MTRGLSKLRNPYNFMNISGEVVPMVSAIFLFLALAMALSFEFVNGFHDTANAVATVIYTHSLPPNVAVVWSGICNLIGVLLSAGTVAYSIVALLPVELVINIGSGAGYAMVFALLLSAIIWNLGTWYLGLPASSSHTLVGAIMGVGLANSMLQPGHVFGEGVNWAKAQEVGISLLVSPVIGFVCSAGLLLLTKAFIKSPELYAAPPKDQPPPKWIRGLLCLTCTGVSFAHGSNDGQKGMGLIMLILVGVVPGAFALKMDIAAADIQVVVTQSQAVDAVLAHHRSPNASTTAAGDLSAAEDDVSAYLKTSGKLVDRTIPAIIAVNDAVAAKMGKIKNFSELSSADRRDLRSRIYLVSGGIAKMLKSKAIADPDGAKTASEYRAGLDKITQYIPTWVKVAVALALGFGTMIGWKRIVVTVGEKIGKSHLTYAQGASAELVAMVTILAADHYSQPVSTTHVLSSGVAGTMAANRSGLQMGTLRNLLLAWVLTLPVCIFLGAVLFAGGFYVILHGFGLK